MKETGKLILGVLLHIAITALIFTILEYKNYSLWITIPLMFLSMSFSIKDFKNLEKDHVSSLINLLGESLGDVNGGQTIWTFFGWRKIHKTYSSQKDTVIDQLENALTNDGKLVSAKFNLVYRKCSPTLLEATSGDNYEKDLVELRKNAYEEFIRGVELHDLETSGQDELSKKEESIKELYKAVGLEVIGKIEVHNIIPKLEKVREEVQQAQFKAETKKINQRAEELAINQKFIALLLDKSINYSYRKLQKEAIEALKLEGGSYDQFDISDEMILILKKREKISESVIRAIRKDAVSQYNREQGNVQSFEGMGGNVRPYYGINQDGGNKRKKQ